VLEFNKSLIAFDLQASEAREVIELLAGRMHAQGLVSADYGMQAWEREVEHPTGLPTKPFCIAFPHAEADGVSRSALGVAVLHQPVKFQNMGDPEEALDVALVFMLANRNPEEQIQTLRNLALLFSQSAKLIELREQTTPQGIETWLRRELCLDRAGGADL